MATKLELIEQLKVCEQKVEELEYTIARHENYYYDATTLHVYIETKERGISESDRKRYLNVSSKLFTDYLKAELKDAKIKSDDLLKKLIDKEGGF